MTSVPLEDLALLGDTQTAALVSRNGELVWLCVPRFDSPAVFAALLGSQGNGLWKLRPTDRGATCTRRYLQDTLVLETSWTCADGEVRVLDFMPPRERHPDVIRVVEGVRGRVTMSTLLRPRFGYGEVAPWIRRTSEGLAALVGGDALHVRADCPLTVQDGAARASFTVTPGQRVCLTLTWALAHEPAPAAVDPDRALRDTLAFWADWDTATDYHGAYSEPVKRSLITLKALTYAPTGAMVAAATMGLPEASGGIRNWDYRYCWLRDATLVMRALLDTGHTQDARAWRDWLLRAAAGDPAQLQIMYGPAGERHIPEWEAHWLPGYDGSRPVWVGNAAHGQFQLDVYGEVVRALHHSRLSGMEPDRAGATWDLQEALAEHVEAVWSKPDQGLWETRGKPAHYVHSKALAWAALDLAAADAEQLQLDAPIARWRQVRDEIRADVLARGYDADRNTFTRSYGTPDLDGALLRLPLVGFLPWDDPRVAGTVAAIEEELADSDGLIRRYSADDELPGHEGAFLACSFWLAQCHAHLGNLDRARALFEQLLDLRNDLGLLSEEYDTVQRRLTGNFPQAFSHVPLVTTALTLDTLQAPPARQRSR